MPAPRQDTYFLDRMDAYHTAVEQNMIADAQNARLQFCYYDGQPFDNAPVNLVHVPFTQFTEFFAANELPLPTCLHANQGEVDADSLQQMQFAFNAVVSELQQLRTSSTPQDATTQDNYEFHDTYYFDSQLALQNALVRHRVTLPHPTIDGLQVCYYNGDVIDNAPDNMVNVPLNNALDFFTHTRLRLPCAVKFPDNLPRQDCEKYAGVFQNLIATAQQERARIGQMLAQANTTLAPGFTAHEPLRVFFITSRLTTVMQYASKNLAAAFRELGHETCVSIEDNDLQALDNRIHMQAYHDFKPHITMNVNHLNNNYLHPDVFNVTWWQDPMPAIRAGEPLPWRERDIVFSFASPTDNYLKQCGAVDVLRQSFCIDTSVFKLDSQVEREDKIVFLGSSYINHLRPTREYIEITNLLTDYLNSGTPITFNLLRSLSHRYAIEYDEIFWNIFHYVTRDKILEWICSQQELPVEVYGSGWQHNPIIAPHHKGILQHGSDIARVYNSARYALVTHPFDINSQRFAEVISCGAIVLMHDCRHCADPPHWDNEIQYFSHPQHLKTILKNRQGEPHPYLAEQFSYRRFAERILNIVQSTLNHQHGLSL